MEAKEKSYKDLLDYATYQTISNIEDLDVWKSDFEKRLRRVRRLRYDEKLRLMENVLTGLVRLTAA